MPPPSSIRTGPEVDLNQSKPAAGNAGPEFRPEAAAAKSPGPALKSADWYCFHDGKPKGPIPEEKLRELLAAAAGSGSTSLNADTLLWTHGMAQWQKASETPLLRPLAAAAPSPRPAPHPYRSAVLRAGPEVDQNRLTPALADGGALLSRSVPAAANRTDSIASTPDWVYTLDGKPMGPIPEEELRDLFASRTLDADTLLWRQGMAQCQKASEAGLLCYTSLALAPSPLSPTPDGEQSAALTAPGPDTPRAAGPGAAGPALQLGRVLRHCLTTFRTRLGTWLLIGMIVALLQAALSQVPFQGAAGLAVNLLTALIVWLAHAVISSAAFQICCDRDFRLADVVDLTLQRFLTIVGMALLVIIGFIVYLIFVMFLGISAFTLGIKGVGSGFLAAIFLTALFAIYVCARIFLSTAACMIEGLGALNSIKRSFQLTKRHPWKVLAIYLVYSVPGLSILAGIVIAQRLAPALVSSLLVSSSGKLLLALAAAPLHCLVIPLGAILATTTYVDLSGATEGLKTGRIAEVFD